MQSFSGSSIGGLLDGLGAIWWMYQLKSWKNADLKIYVFSFPLVQGRFFISNAGLVTEA